MKEHVFHLDPFLAPGARGEQVCLCGLIATSRWHVEPPERTDDERAAEARRMGEKA